MLRCSADEGDELGRSDGTTAAPIHLRHRCLDASHTTEHVLQALCIHMPSAVTAAEPAANILHDEVIRANCLRNHCRHEVRVSDLTLAGLIELGERLANRKPQLSRQSVPQCLLQIGYADGTRACGVQMQEGLPCGVPRRGTWRCHLGGRREISERPCRQPQATAPERPRAREGTEGRGRRWRKACSRGAACAAALLEECRRVNRHVTGEPRVVQCLVSSQAKFWPRFHQRQHKAAANFRNFRPFPTLQGEVGLPDVAQQLLFRGAPEGHLPRQEDVCDDPNAPHVAL
mmetsp:Transcript_2535/g.6425  ORF Transcript_2535/g.6425 Transcript_2535/m.6425 type:complete len:288 (+) Transcript_2535:208-1071(+)